MRSIRVRKLQMYLMLLMIAAPVDHGIAADAPLQSIDLNTFDQAKRQVALGNGITLGLIEMGDRSGRPVVLIHGYTDTSRDWVPLIPYLSPDMHLILVDLRGHGVSSKPECCYTRADLAYDVKLLLDALEVHQAVIVGHSFGSIIAQTFAEYWPERTQSVVLISSTALKFGEPKAKGEDPVLNFRPQIMKLQDPIDPDSPFMIEWFASSTPIDPELPRRERRDAAAIPVRVWVAVLYQGLTDMDLPSTLPMLKAPTLLLWGGQDTLVDQHGRRTLRAALPRAKVKVFANLSHNLFWDDPRAVADALNAFVMDPTRQTNP
jgi:pimeloyl-ACP methyl ester carboxylesterase